mgnify:FL=1
MRGKFQLQKIIRRRVKKDYIKLRTTISGSGFAFIYPNISFIEAGNSEIVMNKIKNNFVDNHVSYVYEDVSREKMWQLNNNCAWSFYFSKIGRYWDAHTEIDICALDPDGKNIIVGECKYWKDKMGLNVLYDLEKKAATIPWNKDDRRMWYVLCSANGYTDELKNAVAERKDVVLM